MELILSICRKLHSEDVLFLSNRSAHENVVLGRIIIVSLNAAVSKTCRKSEGVLTGSVSCNEGNNIIENVSIGGLYGEFVLTKLFVSCIGRGNNYGEGLNVIEVLNGNGIRAGILRIESYVTIIGTEVRTVRAPKRSVGIFIIINVSNLNIGRVNEGRVRSEGIKIIKIEVDVLILLNGNGIADVFPISYKEHRGKIIAPHSLAVIKLELLGGKSFLSIRIDVGSLAGHLIYNVIISSRGLFGSEGYITGLGIVIEVVINSLKVSIRIYGDTSEINNVVFINGERYGYLVKRYCIINYCVAGIVTTLGYVNLSVGIGECVKSGGLIVLHNKILSDIRSSKSIKLGYSHGKSAGIVRSRKKSAGKVGISVKELRISGVSFKLVRVNVHNNGEDLILRNALVPLMLSTKEVLIGIERLIEYVGLLIAKHKVDLIDLAYAKHFVCIINELVCNNVTAGNLMVISDSRVYHSKDISLINFIDLSSAHGALACGVNGMSFLGYLSIAMLANGSIPVITFIGSVLITVDMHVQILDNVCANVALAIAVLIGVSRYVRSCNNVAAACRIPVVGAISGPILGIGMRMVGKFAEVASTIVVCINVVKLIVRSVRTITGGFIPMPGTVSGKLVGISMNVGIFVRLIASGKYRYREDDAQKKSQYSFHNSEPPKVLFILHP